MNPGQPLVLQSRGNTTCGTQKQKKKAILGSEVIPAREKVPESELDY